MKISNDDEKGISRPMGVLSIGCFLPFGVSAFVFLLKDAPGTGGSEMSLVPFISMLYGFGFCPIWATFMIAYGWRHYLVEGRIRFPEIWPRKLAALNLLVAAPLVIPLLTMDIIVLGAFFTSLWSWNALIPLAFGIVFAFPMSVLYFVAMKKAYSDAFRKRDHRPPPSQQIPAGK